jgi:hypothetical protein
MHEIQDYGLLQTKSLMCSKVNPMVMIFPPGHLSEPAQAPFAL